MTGKLKNYIIAGLISLLIAVIYGFHASNPLPSWNATNIGIIGGADGPTSIYVSFGYDLTLALIVLALIIGIAIPGVMRFMKKKC